MIININIDKELYYEADYIGLCDCGCKKELYKGMTIFRFSYFKIYSKCLEKYLNKRKVVL